MRKDTKLYIAGHTGLVGSAVLRAMRNEGFSNLIVRTREQLDLTRQAEVEAFFREERPDVVILAAAKVGGVGANNRYPADFIGINLMIQTHVIDAAYRNGAERLIFLGSSCIYPRKAPQPMKEEHLLTSPLEPTNEPYAVAKIAGVTMCRSYYRQYGFDTLNLQPTNLYGPGDNFDLETSHVLPALIRKFHEAKEQRKPFVTLWGSGTPRREFLHVDDLADAVLFLLRQDSETLDRASYHRLINVGVGEDLSIADLATLIGESVGYEGEIRYDTSKPDGTPRKLLDVSRLHSLGWTATTPLREGIEATYRWYRDRSHGR
ncbi:NAD-dependent epimerase/dehydratase family protein [bacterium]|nr:NAD-dependent epimerase/dehydratase family protein [bacterium]